MSASLTLKLREQADPRLCDRLVYTPPPPSTSNRGQPDGREPTAPFELTLTSSSKGSLTRSTVRAQFIETANVEYEGRVLSLRVIRWTLEIQEGDNLLGGVPFLEGEMCDEPDRVSVHVQLDANGHVLAQGQRFVHYGEDAFGIELNRWACGR